MAGNRAIPAHNPAAGARAAAVPPEARANAPITPRTATVRRPPRARMKYATFGVRKIGSPRDRRPVEWLPGDRAAEGVEVPAVDDEEGDPRLRDHAGPHGVEDDLRARAGVTLARESDQLRVRDPLEALRERILLRILGVHAVHARRVHEPVRLHDAGEARGDPVRRPPRGRPAHQDDWVAAGEAGGLRVRLGRLRVRAGLEGDREEAGVHPRDLDPELVEPPLPRAEGPPRLDVEPGDSPAARDREDLSGRGDVEEKLREACEVRRVAIPRNEDGPAQGDHDPFHGNDRVRIPALRKYLPSSRGLVHESQGGKALRRRVPRAPVWRRIRVRPVARRWKRDS